MKMHLGVAKKNAGVMNEEPASLNGESEMLTKFKCVVQGFTVNL